MIYAGVSIQGKRSRNEDCIFLPRDDRLPLAIVADGMGGHNAGYLASRIAVDAAVKTIEHGDFSRPMELLRHAADEANHAILMHADRDYTCRGMGTTMVMALLFPAYYIVANIGDSRLYHFHNDTLIQITRDHSYVSEMVAAGFITPEEARTHPQRNIITRALGAPEMEQIDLFENAWQPGDILFLCTDGLYGSLDIRDIERVLREEKDLQAACDTLVQIASYGGSTDNISVVLAGNEEANRYYG